MREKTQLDLELSPQIHSLPELAKAENRSTKTQPRPCRARAAGPLT